jgi:hypothetical protein
MKTLRSILVLLLLGCAHANVLPSGDCQTACANLDRLGCPEGKDPLCASTCVKVQSQGLTDVHPECLAAAASPEAARACGTVTCSQE